MFLCANYHTSVALEKAHTEVRETQAAILKELHGVLARLDALLTNGYTDKLNDFLNLLPTEPTTSTCPSTTDTPTAH